MRQSFRRERSFGLSVGGVLIALGAWWIYRGKFAPVASGALAVGAVLVLLGAAAPALLFHPHRWWMALAEKMSWVMTRVILAIVYYIVLLPIGIVRRLSGADPLRRRHPPVGSSWVPYPARHRDPRHYDKSF